MDGLERGMRRLTAAAWLVPVALATHGVWRSRQAGGRTVGRPFGALPVWGMAMALPAYLTLVVSLWRPLPWRLPTAGRAVASGGGAALSLAGLALITWGRLALGHMYNVSSVLGVRLNTGPELVTGGPFAYVRHPMYVGAFIAGAGAVLLYRTWATVFLLAHGTVFVLRARKEEQALAQEFGPTWDAYSHRVPAWLPRLARPVPNGGS